MSLLALFSVVVVSSSEGVEVAEKSEVVRVVKVAGSFHIVDLVGKLEITDEASEESIEVSKSSNSLLGSRVGDVIRGDQLILERSVFLVNGIANSLESVQDNVLSDVGGTNTIAIGNSRDLEETFNNASCRSAVVDGLESVVEDGSDLIDTSFDLKDVRDESVDVIGVTIEFLVLSEEFHDVFRSVDINRVCEGADSEQREKNQKSL